MYPINVTYSLARQPAPTALASSASKTSLGEAGVPAISADRVLLTAC